MKNADLPHLTNSQDQPCRQACRAAIAEETVTANFDSQGTVAGEIVDWRVRPPVLRQKEDKAKKIADNREGFSKEVFLVSGMDWTATATVRRGKVEVRLPVEEIAVEKWSEHPLAKAIVEKAKGIGSLPAATGFKALVGRSAQAEIDGQTVFIGNLRLFEELGGLPWPNNRQALGDLEQDGKTVMLLGVSGRIFPKISRKVYYA